MITNSGRELINSDYQKLIIGVQEAAQKWLESKPALINKIHFEVRNDPYGIVLVFETDTSLVDSFGMRVKRHSSQIVTWSHLDAFSLGRLDKLVGMACKRGVMELLFWEPEKKSPGT